MSKYIWYDWFMIELSIKHISGKEAIELVKARQ